MEGFQEDDILLREDDQPSPKPKLRRLKKASSECRPRIRDPPGPPPPSHPVHHDLQESPFVTEPRSFLAAEATVARLEQMEVEVTRPDKEIDPLFPDLGGFRKWETQNSEIGWEDDQDSEGREVREMIDGNTNTKSAKKRLSLEAEGEKEKASKRRKKKNDELHDFHGNPKDPVREKRKTKKETKEQLAQIHADSQRLLRETKDASFKPIPSVHKPISSVLEKIRLRKLEILGKSNVKHISEQIDDASIPLAGPPAKFDLASTKDERDDHILSKMTSGTQGNDTGGCRNIMEQDGTATSSNGFDSRIEETIHNSTADGLRDYEHSAQEKITSNDITNNYLMDTICSSLPTSSLISEPADTLLDDAPPSSSSEEDNDKENVTPQYDKLAKMNSYLKDSAIKAFLDDEAEEEDDSDHDLMRFQETDEDDISDENEVVYDLISTGFEEAPVDIEKRNYLHQKWLEQQDAAETSNVMQRLKYGQTKKDPTLINEEEDTEESEDVEEEDSFDLATSDLVRKNSKKAKSMIVNMFNDDNDAYEPSDDEETEQTLRRQRLSYRTVGSTLVSPTEDDNSREVFGLIKKLNIAPPSKKRTNTVTSSFDTLMVSHNSNSSSKSSFLGRSSSCTIQSSYKQGSSNVRGFIFGRDDSNSRSGVSASDKLSDLDQVEDQSSIGSSAKLSLSQRKSASSGRKVEAHAKSGASLFEILQQSSKDYDKQMEAKLRQSKNSKEIEATNHFSAFKLGRK